MTIILTGHKHILSSLFHLDIMFGRFVRKHFSGMLCLPRVMGFHKTKWFFLCPRPSWKPCRERFWFKRFSLFLANFYGAVPLWRRWLLGRLAKTSKCFRFRGSIEPGHETHHPPQINLFLTYSLIFRSSHKLDHRISIERTKMLLRTDRVDYKRRIGR